MIEYKYKKRENKFTENGHTMFEADVLARLQRLAYLEEQVKQGGLLPKHLVSCTLPTTNELNKELDEYKELLGESALSDWINGYDFLLKHVTKTK